MAYFRFTAKESIASGYSVDDVVDISVKCSTVDPDLEVFKETHISYDRSNRVHAIQGRETKTVITTGPIIGIAQNDLMKMFLDSVKDGSSVLGNTESNVGVGLVSLQLEGKPGKPQVLSKTIKVYSFTVVAV